MTLTEARRFLIANDPVKARVNGTWSRIRKQWKLAQSIVDDDKNDFLKLAPRQPEES